jgi:predicted porin
MKKSLLALAALTAFAGAASAQSSVTLFGVVDAGYARLSAGGRSASGLTNSGLNSSRLGFRGVEDMGGGLRAGFWLEAAVGNDDGSSGGSNGIASVLFNRRSTVSLIGNFGEIRLGRDYTPHFWNTTVYDPFGTNGVGQAMTPGMIGAAGAAAGVAASTAGLNAVRANNTIGYFLPGNLGGFNGQFQYGFGENLSTAPNKGQRDYFGFRLGYGAGPFAANYGFGNSRGASGASNVKYNNVGLSFDFGFIKPMFVWASEKAGTGAKVTGIEGGLTVPLGQGELRAAYSRYDVSGTGVSSNDWNKMALGYGYNLSKRTQLYGTAARVSNKGAQTMAVANNGLSAGAAAPGKNSTGYELGIRHAF